MFAITFLESSAGTVIRALLASVGVLIAIGGVFKAVGTFAKGSIGPGVKTLLGTLALCVFLFQPEMLVSVISLIGDLIQSLINGGSEVVKTPTVDTLAP